MHNAQGTVLRAVRTEKNMTSENMTNEKITAADTAAADNKKVCVITGGGSGMGLATAKSTESIARQPEAEGKVRTTLMLGLVFIETAIIYALLVVILIIFVL